MADENISRSEKRILLLLKSCYALAWGALTGITYQISARFATVMTGNLLLLAVEAREWRVEEMLLTASLIAAYIGGGIAYDALNILVEDKGRVLGVAMFAVVSMGALGDGLRHAQQSCTEGDRGRALLCEGKDLYFLTPISFLTGIVAGGYCNAHPDGVVSTLLTGHMRIPPNALLQICLGRAKDASARTILRDKAVLSLAIVVAFFCGILAGDAVEDRVRERYARREFTPVFTLVGGFLAALCVAHSRLCERFLLHHRR